MHNHRPRAARFAICLAAGLLGSGIEPAIAADASCGPVAKAFQAGLAQPRIHAAIDSPPDPEAVKMGFKPTLMHSIVIGQVQYSNAIRAGFSRTALESADMRLLASDLAPFAVEVGCKAAGSEKLAGRDAQVFLATGDLGRGEIRFKLWIDKASGLPLRAVSDEPDVDVDVQSVLQKLGKKGVQPELPIRPAPNGKRMVGTHAYVFGDAVKPPGPAGALDAQALAQLQRLLKGAP